MQTKHGLNRAETFDLFSEDYDKFRPKFPKEFADTDVNIIAIDPGQHLLAIAKKNYKENTMIEFFCNSFENFDCKSILPSRQTQLFDFVFAANSFHWVNPNIGYKNFMKF